MLPLASGRDLTWPHKDAPPIYTRRSILSNVGSSLFFIFFLILVISYTPT
jgi:hypothetical protein